MTFQEELALLDKLFQLFYPLTHAQRTRVIDFIIDRLNEQDEQDALNKWYSGQVNGRRKVK